MLAQTEKPAGTDDEINSLAIVGQYHIVDVTDFFVLFVIDLRAKYFVLYAPAVYRFSRLGRGCVLGPGGRRRHSASRAARRRGGGGGGGDRKSTRLNSSH